MLTYDMERRGTLARYDYLYRCIKEDILAGRLTAGEKLPSKRALAAHLQLGVVTVESAYAQLVAEGYVRAEEKRGYFVNELEAKPNPPPVDLFQEKAPREQENWLLDLKEGGSGTEGFPFSVWARLTRRVLTDRGEELLRATPHNGAAVLRRALAAHLYEFRGIRVSPEQIVVGAGTEYLYNLLVQLLGRDRRYGSEDPGYYKAARIYAICGADCRPLPVDEQGVEVQTLENEKIQILHISPNHQFPTGVVTPIGRRQSLLRWAQQAPDRYIIEDDYDSEFRFTGRPIPTLQSIDNSGRVIYVNTFSRSLAPSMRISYMVLPTGLLEEYRRRLGFYSCTVPSIEQYTLADFLDGGYFESHLNRMRVRYRDRRDRVISMIQESPLAGRCEVLREDAGLHFLLRLRTDRTDRELAGLAEQRKIRLSFLTDYQMAENAAQPHTLIINYPRIDLTNLAGALTVLSGLL